MKIKQTFLLAVCLCCLQGLHGQVIQWTTDTSTRFSVTLSGNGHGWRGSTTSPSGMWRLDHSGYFAEPSLYGTNHITFKNFPAGGTVTFVPTGEYLAYEPYVDDLTPNTVPVSDGSSIQLQPSFPGDWHGVNSLTITSEPDPLDPLTWSFTLRYWGGGSAFLQPPGFVTQPQSTTASIGGTAQFDAVVYPPNHPKSFQWRFNGENLPGGGRFMMASNVNYSSLTISNAQISDDGDYTLVASNSVGVVTSVVARLTVRNVLAWGLDGAGQTQISPNASQIKAIAAGAYHSLALKADGTVVGWGENDFGQTDPPTGLTNVTDMAAGWGTSLALKRDGTLTEWGWDGGYGLKSTAESLTNITAISACWDCLMALTRDGTVLVWGRTTHGETNQPAGLTSVTAIAGGGFHCLALKSDGTVAAWGDNSEGQLNVPAGLSDVVRIAAGGYHSLALKADGTVVGWGKNLAGQTNVPPDLAEVVAISGGGAHSLALKSDGYIAAWGDNSSGQTNVPASLTNVLAIAAGGGHNLALVGRRAPWTKFKHIGCDSNGQVHFTVSGMCGDVYQILGSTNLLNWQTLTTVTNVTGTLDFTDAESATYPQRFYRLRLP